MRGMYCTIHFHLLIVSIPDISQNIPHWGVFLYKASSPPSPENPSTRHRLLDRTRDRQERRGEDGRYGLPSLSARESNGGQTDGLNLHGRLSAFPISRMHTFSSPGNSLGSRRGRAEGGRLIINGVDFGINQGRESRRASSRANEKKKGDWRRERVRGVGPSTTAKLIRQA